VRRYAGATSLYYTLLSTVEELRHFAEDKSHEYRDCGIEAKESDVVHQEGSKCCCYHHCCAPAE
jgi:hypothetical protein